VEAVSYYKKFYKASSIVNTNEQVKVIGLFPGMVNDEETGPVYNSDTLEELKFVLFQFKKDKILGSNS